MGSPSIVSASIVHARPTLEEAPPAPRPEAHPRRQAGAFAPLVSAKPERGRRRRAMHVAVGARPRRVRRPKRTRSRRPRPALAPLTRALAAAHAPNRSDTVLPLLPWPQWPPRAPPFGRSARPAPARRAGRGPGPRGRPGRPPMPPQRRRRGRSATCHDAVLGPRPTPRRPHAPARARPLDAPRSRSPRGTRLPGCHSIPNCRARHRSARRRGRAAVDRRDKTGGHRQRLRDSAESRDRRPC